MNKIAVLGDTHGNLYYLDKALSHIKNNHEDVHIVYQVGDWGFATKLKDLQDLLTQHEMIMIFIDGNHEDYFVLQNSLGVDLSEPCFTQLNHQVSYARRGTSYKVYDSIITFCGGATTPSWYSGRVFPEEEITEDNLNKVLQHKDTDVLITHESPSTRYIELAIARAGGISYPECERSRSMIDAMVRELEPKLVFHGHHHVRYTETINSTTTVYGLGCTYDDPEDQYVILNPEDLSVESP